MLILTDLDDTLFQTARKCPADDPALLPMSWLEDGQPSGFATQAQQRLLGWLQAGEIVPVTARSRAVLARVDIAQAPAICANGGCILTAQGQRDRAWHDHLLARSREGCTPAEVYAALRPLLSGDHLRHWIVAEDDLDLYLVIKSNIDDGAILAELAPSLAERLPPDWRCHRNGNNLAFLPPWLTKRDAVRHLIDRLRARAPHRLVIGIGDSHSDSGFMDLCDYAMMPTTSQIWRGVAMENPWC